LWVSYSPRILPRGAIGTHRGTCASEIFPTRAAHAVVLGGRACGAKVLPLATVYARRHSWHLVVLARATVGARRDSSPANLPNSAVGTNDRPQSIAHLSGSAVSAIAQSIVAENRVVVRDVLGNCGCIELT